MEIAEILSAQADVLKITAYGSRVRGDFSGDSDLDVLVTVKTKRPELKEAIINAFYEQELRTGIPFSVVIFSLEEYEINRHTPFMESLNKEGIVFYDSEHGRKKVPL